MGEVFSSSGEKTDSVVVPTPRLQGLFVPGIDNPEAVDGFGTVIPWGGGNTARRYADYGISTGRETQLNDLASSFIPAEGAGVTYNFEGLVGPQGIPGRDGIDGISHLIVAPNSNFLTALPHNIDQINALGTALNKLIYTDSYETYYDIAGNLTWTERQPAGADDKNWQRVASDSDGSNLIACINNGRLYTSNNSGVSWTERQPAGNVDRTWTDVASDSDGSNLIACASGPAGGRRLYTSDDSGATWTERTPAGAGDKYWYAVASDSDGSNLIACINNGRLYTSNNSGVSWTERQPAGADDKNWQRVASDSDGSHLVAGAGPGRLYTSDDSGATWTERQPAGDVDRTWAAIASNNDGTKLVAAAYSGRLYTSANSGVSWTERQPAGNVDRRWINAASNSDGTILIACATGTDGRLYISADSGINWTEEQPAGVGDKDWYAAASDSDGSHLITAIAGGRLYTGVRPISYSEAIWGESDLTSAGRDLLGDADVATQATTLGLGTGDSPAFAGATITGCSVLGLNSAVFQPTTDSTTFGQFLDAASASILNLDSTNRQVTVGQTSATYPFLINSVDGSDQIKMYHDNSYAYIKWDNTLRLITDTGTNTNTYVDIRGKGTGRGFLYVSDQDNAEYIYLTAYDGAGFLQVGGTSPVALNFQNTAIVPITMFKDAAEGQTQELQIHGYRTSDSERVLGIGVGVDAADTVSFDGLTNYWFNGEVDAQTKFKVTGTQVVGARVIDARCDDAINSGDAITDGVIDALRDCLISHGLLAAS